MVEQPLGTSHFAQFEQLAAVASQPASAELVVLHPLGEVVVAAAVVVHSKGHIVAAAAAAADLHKECWDIVVVAGEAGVVVVGPFETAADQSSVWKES